MNIRRKFEARVDLWLVISLFFPVFWEQLASMVLAMVSSIISTNIDTSFLNATSLVGSVFGPFTTLYGCVASGAAILVSQYIGAGDEERSRNLFSTSMLIGTLISIVISSVIIFFHNPILRATYPDMSEAFFVNANIYSVFYAITLPMGFFRTNMIGILRGCLNTKGPLYISLFGGIIDILTKWIFMIVFDMGIIGLGIASLITNLLFTVICAVIILTVGTFKGCVKDVFKLYKKDVANDIIKIGAVMCAQTFIVSVGSLVLSKIFSTMGDTEVSALSITSSVETLIHITPLSLAYVVQILAGKHTGAGDKREAMNISLRLTLGATILHVIICAIAYFFAGNLVGMYTSDSEIIEIGERAMKIALIILPIGWAGGNLLPAGLRGMGNVKYPAAVLVLSLWLFRIPATWYVCTVLDMGAWGVKLVYSLEFVLHTLLFVIYTICYKIKEKI